MPRERRISRQALASAQDRFIEAWGRMGPAWGISRTMAEVHALLYITGQPTNTDEVMERLRISRGNASMSLRSLLEWGVVSRVHKRGDRKEYFTAEQDVWTMARAILRERLRRELHPTLAALHEIRDSTAEEPAAATGGSRKRLPAVAGVITPDGDTPRGDDVARHNRRLDSLISLIQTFDRLAERFVGIGGVEGKGLRMAATVLAKIV